MATRRVLGAHAADDDQVCVRRLGPELREALEQVGQSLERHVGADDSEQPPRHLRDLGLRTEDLLVHADGHDVDAVRVDAELVDDVAARRLRHGDETRQLAHDALLHPEEGIPAPQRDLLPRVGPLEIEPLVHGDRVVDRREERHTLRDPHHARAERLVVVDDVEPVPVLPQPGVGAQAERPRLGERAGRHDRQLEPVDLRTRPPVRAEGVLRAVQVHALDPVEDDVGIDLGVRGTGQHLDVVAEVGQLTREMADVDALCDAQGIGHIEVNLGGRQTRRSITGCPRVTARGARRSAPAWPSASGSSWVSPT